jgi:hypothetical protein
MRRKPRYRAPISLRNHECVPECGQKLLVDIVENARHLNRDESSTQGLSDRESSVSAGSSARDAAPLHITTKSQFPYDRICRTTAFPDGFSSVE